MADITGFQRDRDGIFIVKDPSANTRFQLDWTDYLATNSDTISSAAVTIETHTGDLTPWRCPQTRQQMLVFRAVKRWLLG